MLSAEPAVQRPVGTGLADPIRLYAAWGRDFLVLLDSDQEGRKQRSRYEDLFGGLVRDRVLCLENVDSSWARRGMEARFDEDDRLGIQRAAYPEEARYKKQSFNRAVQEVLATGRSVSVSDASLNRFRTLLQALRSRLNA